MPRSLSSRLAIAAVVLFAASGCAPPPPPHSARELVLAAYDAGLPLENPLKLDAEIRGRVERAVGLHGSEAERFHRLRDYLSETGELKFRYAPISYDAEQAYHERRGDCMSYALLFIGLARALDVAAYFVHVSEVRNYYEHGGSFFVSSHVAVGFGSGPQATVIDFSAEKKDWELAVYSAIDDGKAAALFFNNLAVDHMLRGDTSEAEKLLAFLHGHEPGLEELANNYGVLLNREHRYTEALAVLRSGIAEHEEYGPFYTNGMLAARGAGRTALADWLALRGQSLASEDPFFLFARGLSLYERDDFQGAAAALERASSAKPDSAVILGWLTRAYLASGEPTRGRDAFARARKLAPSANLIRELWTLYPELH